MLISLMKLIIIIGILSVCEYAPLGLVKKKWHKYAEAILPCTTSLDTVQAYEHLPLGDYPTIYMLFLSLPLNFCKVLLQNHILQFVDAIMVLYSTLQAE
jgi:hypothetical protein